LRPRKECGGAAVSGATDYVAIVVAVVDLICSVHEVTTLLRCRARVMHVSTTKGWVGQTTSTTPQSQIRQVSRRRFCLEANRIRQAGFVKFMAQRPQNNDAVCADEKVHGHSVNTLIAFQKPLLVLLHIYANALHALPCSAPLLNCCTTPGAAVLRPNYFQQPPSIHLHSVCPPHSRTLQSQDHLRPKAPRAPSLGAIRAESDGR
jgi:hypothetical protein